MFVFPIHLDLLEEREARFEAVPGANKLDPVHEFLGCAGWLLLEGRNRLHVDIYLTLIDRKSSPLTSKQHLNSCQTCVSFFL